MHSSNAPRDAAPLTARCDSIGWRDQYRAAGSARLPTRHSPRRASVETWRHGNREGSRDGRPDVGEGDAADVDTWLRITVAIGTLGVPRTSSALRLKGACASVKPALRSFNAIPVVPSPAGGAMECDCNHR